MRQTEIEVLKHHFKVQTNHLIKLIKLASSSEQLDEIQVLIRYNNKTMEKLGMKHLQLKQS